MTHAASLTRVVRGSWRLLNADTLGEDYGARGGLIEYKARAVEPTDDDLGGAHENPEYYYVISGRGVVGLPGVRTPDLGRIGLRHPGRGAALDLGRLPG